MRYPIMIEVGDDDTAFGVAVPDLQGCFSAGDTLDDAVTNVREAATLWIEDALDRGAAIPAPSRIDAVRTDPQWAGWVVGVVEVDPALFDSSAERVNITLPRKVLARLDVRAKAAGETRSGFIASLAMHA